METTIIVLIIIAAIMFVCWIHTTIKINYVKLEFFEKILRENVIYSCKYKDKEELFNFYESYKKYFSSEDRNKIKQNILDKN